MIRFFVSDDIAALISKRKTEISSYEKMLMQKEEKYEVPIFVYSYAIFESTITEILRYYLIAFPEKMDKTLHIGKEQLLFTPMTHDILMICVEEYIRKYSSKTLSEYLCFFKETLDIKIGLDFSLVKEISHQRNSIVHDRFRGELLSLYTHKENPLHFNITVLLRYIRFFYEVLDSISTKICSKYTVYTKEKLVRDIWNYVFQSPVLQFDGIWDFDKNGIITIKNIKNIKEKVKSISSTERLFLAIFIQQFSGNINEELFSFRTIPSFASLDNNSKNKLIELINFFRYYPLFFMGEEVSK